MTGGPVFVLSRTAVQPVTAADDERVTIESVKNICFKLVVTEKVDAMKKYYKCLMIEKIKMDF